MYEDNYPILKQVCREGSVLRHASRHRDPDGAMNIAGNRYLYRNSGLASGNTL